MLRSKYACVKCGVEFDGLTPREGKSLGKTVRHCAQTAMYLYDFSTDERSDHDSDLRTRSEREDQCTHKGPLADSARVPGVAESTAGSNPQSATEGALIDDDYAPRKNESEEAVSNRLPEKESTQAQRAGVRRRG